MAIGLMLIGGGVLLVTAAVTGRHPWAPVVTAFGGEEPAPPGGSPVDTAAATGADLTATAPGGGKNGTAAIVKAARGRSRLTAAQVAAFAKAAGFTSHQIPIMVAIAFRESRFEPGAVNSNGGATGLWQIYPGGEQYKDPLVNARAARAKFVASKAAGYSGYRPWASSQPIGSPF